MSTAVKKANNKTTYSTVIPKSEIKLNTSENIRGSNPSNSSVRKSFVTVKKKKRPATQNIKNKLGNNFDKKTIKDLSAKDK